MAIWELALLLVAVTFTMVNIINVIIQLKIITKIDGFMAKWFTVMNKGADYANKMLDKATEELGED